MKKEDILKLFEEKKALLKGHFLLSSGLHSDTYLQCALILQYPQIAEKLARELISRWKKHYTLHITHYTDVNLVVSPALGGIIIGQEVARVLDCRAIFTEREEVITSGRKMTLRRGFQIKKGEKVLVVEDVITTGGSTQEVIDLVKNTGGRVVGIACIIDRSGGETKFEYPFIPLLKLEITNYQPENCPLCKKNIPLVKPGSRKRG